MNLDLFEHAKEKLQAKGEIRFEGPEIGKQDTIRLTNQILRVHNVLKTGIWYTLKQISDLTGDPEASCSAQLRHLRKERFGSHTIEKRNLGYGLWEYRMVSE